MSEVPLVIEPLSKHHDRSEFSCGILALDRYIKDQASQDVKRWIISVFVAAIDNKVIGFFTLSATLISRESLPIGIERQLPKYPTPAALFGRLAVDISCQKKQIGRMLMVNAMKRIVLASTVLGIYALVVDTKDETAKSFYKYFGFIELIDRPMSLFLPLDTIVDLVQT